MSGIVVELIVLLKGHGREMNNRYGRGNRERGVWGRVRASHARRGRGGAGVLPYVQDTAGPVDDGACASAFAACVAEAGEDWQGNQCVCVFAWTGKGGGC